MSYLFHDYYWILITLPEIKRIKHKTCCLWFHKWGILRKLVHPSSYTWCLLLSQQLLTHFPCKSLHSCNWTRTKAAGFRPASKTILSTCQCIPPKAVRAQGLHEALLWQKLLWMRILQFEGHAVRSPRGFSIIADHVRSASTIIYWFGKYYSLEYCAN